MLRKTSTIAVAALMLTAAAIAQTEKPDTPSRGTAITIYNQNFALVRQVFPMESLLLRNANLRSIRCWQEANG